MAMTIGAVSHTAALGRTPAECVDFEGSKWVDCLTAHSGASSGTALAAQGRDFLQALITKDEHGIFIQFQPTPDGPIIMELRDPFATRPAYLLTIGEAEWQKIVTRWRSLPADAAKAHAKMMELEAANEKNGQETVCLHSWYAHYELNAAGALQAIEGNGCNDPGVMEFADLVAADALASAPPCALLDERFFGIAPSRLEECLILQGNKLTAAMVLNATPYLDPIDSNNQQRTKVDFERMIAPGGWFLLAGHAKATGPEAVADAWIAALAKMRYADFEPDIVEGSDDGATIDGWIWRFVEGQSSAHYDKAPYRQKWQRQSDGSFRLYAWEIGTFVEDADR